MNEYKIKIILLGILYMGLEIPLAQGEIAPNSANAEKTLSKDTQRHFVRLVIDKEKDIMTFEGTRVSEDTWPAILQGIPNPSHTVLEIAFTPGTAPEQGSRAWHGIAGEMNGVRNKYGLEYISFVGEHPLGSKGGTFKTYIDSQGGASEAYMFAEPLLYIGPLFIAIAIPLILKKIPPNMYYGVRTEKTCKPGNEEIWYKANKYGGWQFLIAGFIFTFCIVLLFILEEKIPTAVEVILFSTGFVAIFVAVIRSLLYVKKL